MDQGVGGDGGPLRIIGLVATAGVVTTVGGTAIGVETVVDARALEVAIGVGTVVDAIALGVAGAVAVTIVVTAGIATGLGVGALATTSLGVGALATAVTGVTACEGTTLGAVWSGDKDAEVPPGTEIYALSLLIPKHTAPLGSVRPIQ